MANRKSKPAPSTGVAKSSRERDAARVLVDRLSEDLKCPELWDRVALVRSRWQELNAVDDDPERSPYAARFLSGLRGYWITLVQVMLENWQAHHVALGTELDRLADWVTVRLLWELGAGWTPEEEDVRALLQSRWYPWVLEELRSWRALETAAVQPGGRLYNFDV